MESKRVRVTREEEEAEELEAFWNSSEEVKVPSIYTKPLHSLTRTSVATPPIWGTLVEIPGELDTLFNPYTNEPIEPCTEGTDKVSFYEPTHSYALQDERGAYPELILSGSKVINYMKTFVELGADVSKLQLVTKRIKESQFKTSKGRTKDTLADFQRVLVRYFNRLCKQLTEEEELVLPRTYPERASFFHQLCPKREMTYFLPTRILDRLENALLQLSKGNNDVLPLYDLTDPMEYLTYQEVVAHLLPHQATLHPWMQSLIAAPVADFPLNSFYLEERYALPSLYGTALHAYIEHRLKGESQETCLEQYPLAEKEDVDQVEAFIRDGKPKGLTLQHLEYRVGSYRHKICGSIDAVYRQEEDGMWVLFDWKRTPWIFERGKRILKDVYCPWLGCPRKDNISSKFYLDGKGTYHLGYRNICRSDEVYEYMIQLAVYRKLCILNGEKVSTIAYLVIFHPLYPTYRKLELHLDRTCKNGLGAPIQVVNWIFAQREEHLNTHFAF